METRLLCDIQLLECYRTVLLQRPPNLFPSMFPDLDFPHEIDSSSMENFGSLSVLSTLQILMTPGRPAEKLICPSHSIYSLASLATLCWHAMSTSPAASIAVFPWRKEAFHLALNKWANSHQTLPNPSVLMLFHMTSVGLCVNITHIHGIAHLRLQNTQSPLALIEHLKEMPELATEDCQAAIWHSEQIVRLAKRLTNSPPENASGKICQTLRPSEHSSNPSSDSKRNTADPEPPHIAFCIYLAHLMLWSAALVRLPSDTEALNAQLDTGIYILSHLKVRVAKVFQNVLRRLKTV